MVERYVMEVDFNYGDDTKAVPVKDPWGQWVRVSDYDADLAAARAKIERLRAECAAAWDKCEERKLAQEKAEAERDEARAQVTVMVKEAVNICKDSEASTSDDPEGRMIAAWFSDAASEIRTLTPADAKAALEAYGREKVREGMQRAADLIDQNFDRNGWSAHNAILAEMETLI